MSTSNWSNDTLSTLVFNLTTVMPDAVMMDITPKRHVTLVSQLVLTLVYITGVIGNVSALIILFHRDKVIRWKKIMIPIINRVRYKRNSRCAVSASSDSLARYIIYDNEKKFSI